MTDKPTPKEIDDLVYELRQAGKDDTYSLVCAVLAKWGQPVVAGEPFGYFHQLLDHEGKGNGVWLGAAERKVVEQAHTPGETSEEIVALYTTPQPTQPVAQEPLSHAQAKALVLKYGNDPLNLVFQVELAHGIKGGQHGPNT